jgi:uncharacterized membrane protein
MAKNTRNLVLTSVFVALIIVMTVVPYTGYINYGVIEITTLHIVVALGAVCLGWKAGAFLGFVWGFTCVLRAFTNPAWLLFTNPMISLVPRVCVGAVAGLVFSAVRSTKIGETAGAALAGAAATLTNTVLVLSAIYIFGGMIESYRAFFELFKTILSTLIAVNGVIELIAAVLVTPIIYRALQKSGALPQLNRS